MFPALALLWLNPLSAPYSSYRCLRMMTGCLSEEPEAVRTAEGGCATQAWTPQPLWRIIHIAYALRSAAREPSAEWRRTFLLLTRHLCLSACYALWQHAGLLSAVCKAYSRSRL